MKWLKWCLLLTLEPRTTILVSQSYHEVCLQGLYIPHSTLASMTLSVLSCPNMCQCCPGFISHGLTHHLGSSKDLSLNPPSTHKDLFESKWQPSSHRAHHQTRVTPFGRNTKRLEICFNSFSLPSFWRLQSQFESGCHIAKHRS